MKNETGPTKMETLVGGTSVSVQFSDGKKEEVSVNQIKLRHLQRYGSLIAISDEAGQIEMFTGKDAAWVDSLMHESALAVLKEGQRVNQDFFVSWAARMDEMAKMLAEKIPKSNSPNTLPNSPANPDSPSVKPPI